jgi:hypothetical protein
LVLGTGTLAALLSPVFQIVAPKEELSDPEAFVLRRGVYIAGESVPFSSSGTNVRAHVNELAFTDAMYAMAERTGTVEQVDQFLDTYPLRIRLHKAGFGNVGEYHGTYIATHPELRFSTSSLRSYYQTQLSKSDAWMRFYDRDAIHELRHLWQNAVTPLLHGVSRAVKTFEQGAMTTTSLMLGVRYSECNGGITWKGDKAATVNPAKLGMHLLISGALGMVAGDLLTGILTPDELDAYGHEQEFVDLSAVAKHRGDFFRFEAVNQ